MANTKDKVVQLKKEAMIKALYKHKGNISLSCTAAKIGRNTFYEWLKKDKALAEAVENIKEYAIDTVEDALMKRIADGDTTAIIFYLKTIGKKRGYIEKSEFGFTDKDGKDVNKFVFVPAPNCEPMKDGN